MGMETEVSSSGVFTWRPHWGADVSAQSSLCTFLVNSCHMLASCLNYTQTGLHNAYIMSKVCSLLYLRVKWSSREPAAVTVVYVKHKGRQTVSMIRIDYRFV